MNILFVENRYTTQLFERVAERLVKLGHRIAWMVQNHRFAPRNWERVSTIPYPGPANLRLLAHDSRYAAIAGIDRGIRYFGGSSSHYLHYAACIDDILDRENPDVVFGESTQFHELITVALCQERGIRYLHPTATRIPHGRICFMQGDTLDSFAGEGIHLPPAQARAIVEAVAQRRYHAFTNAGAVRKDRFRVAATIRTARQRTTMSVAWLHGERFVTPSPRRKRHLDKRRDGALAAFDLLQTRKAEANAMPARSVLYAMQMQPETNIDVWGAPWHDQAQIIRDAAQSLAGSGCKLLVKLNPTPKYEMLEPGLFDALADGNVALAPRLAPMAPLFAGASGVLSVTGSVIFECIFSGKPVFVLGSHAMSRLPGVTAITQPSALGATVLAAAATGAVASGAQALQVVQDVVYSSYPGYWFDPVSMGQFNTEENLAALADAFHGVLLAVGRMSAVHARPVGALN